MLVLNALVIACTIGFYLLAFLLFYIIFFYSASNACMEVSTILTPLDGLFDGKGFISSFDLGASNILCFKLIFLNLFFSRAMLLSIASYESCSLVAFSILEISISLGSTVVSCCVERPLCELSLVCF